MTYLKSLVVVIALSLGTGCATAPGSLSPIGVRAFHASRVVSVLDVVRDTALAAEAATPPLLSTDATRLIVEWHRSALAVAGASPTGWQGTALSSLVEVMRQLTPAEREVVAPYVNLALAILRGAVMADVNQIGAVVTIASEILPSIVGLIHAFRRQQDPNAPTATDADVLAALHEAISQSLAKDDQWLAAHPRPSA